VYKGIYQPILDAMFCPGILKAVCIRSKWIRNRLGMKIGLKNKNKRL
jgi:hypothetical protein